MNPEKPSREEIEAKLTALLLGELPAEEAQLLRWAVSQDAALAKLHDRLKATIGFVSEVAANPTETIPAQTAPLKLSDERREKLLAHFKTIAPREFVPLVPPLKKRREISPLLAMAAAIALIAVLAAMLLPALASSKSKAKRAMAMNQEKLRELNASYAPVTAIVESAPSATASPAASPAVSEQRVASIEARFQNGDSTASRRDSFQKQNQTTIVLPAGGTDDQKLAIANPDSTANFNLGLAGGGAGGGSASGNFQRRLQSIDQRAAGESGGAFYAGVNKDDASGLKMELSQSTVAQNQTGNGGDFFRSPALSTAADKVPILGDVPLMGSLFQSENRSVDQDGEIAANTASPMSNDINAPKLSKSTTGALALNTVNSVGGETTFVGDVTALSSSDQLLAGGLRNNGPAKDENGNKPQGFDWYLGQLRNDGVVAGGGRAPAPAVAPPVVMSSPAPLTRALPILRSTAGTQGSPGDASITYANVKITGVAGMVFTDTVQVALAPPTAAPATLPASATDIDSFHADVPIKKLPQPAPVPQPEILTRENAFSIFSLNVSDVSFKLAAASLERGQLPDAASIRSEEFLNAFNYRDPEPAAGVPVAFVAERARDPFAHNRDLLRFSIKTAAAGREPGRPLNLVLLLDNSGSMERADRVAIIHEALKVLASQLQPQDTLSIVTFARTARLWVDGARGDQAGDAVSKVSDLTPEGGTNLEEAMNLAYATARRHYLANGGNRVVLLTDGAANLGNVNPEALKQKVESFRKQGIALDCFGIGWEGYNDDLLEVLSSNGDGRYGFINTPEAATTEFAAQLAGALHVAAEDVKVQVEFNPQRVISWRQIGYAKHQLTKEQFRDNTVAAAPMAAREAGNALYTVEINPQGEGPVATVRVRFRIPGTTDVSEHEWQVPFDGTAPALEQSSPALRIAATASAFSEWLASSPFAQEVTTDQLLNYLNGVPAIYGADARPKQLETMLREAKSLSGK